MEYRDAIRHSLSFASFSLMVFIGAGASFLLSYPTPAKTVPKNTPMASVQKSTAQKQPVKMAAPRKSVNTKNAIFAEWKKGWTPEAIARVRGKYQRSIAYASAKKSVDSAVIVSIIGIESGGKNIIGAHGERGPMQIKLATAEKYVDPTKLDIPHYNILAGTSYVSDLKKRYDGDLVKTIAAYNRGKAPKDIDPEKDYHLKKFFHLYWQEVKVY